MLLTTTKSPHCSEFNLEAPEAVQDPSIDLVLAGGQNNTATMEGSLAVPQKVKHRITV